MGIEEKIAKLEALINSTKHAGERESAILARERLLKKLIGKLFKADRFKASL